MFTDIIQDFFHFLCKARQRNANIGLVCQRGLITYLWIMIEKLNISLDRWMATKKLTINEKKQLYKKNVNVNI